MAKIDKLSLSYLLSHCNRMRRKSRRKKNRLLLDMENSRRPPGMGEDGKSYGFMKRWQLVIMLVIIMARKCIRLKPRRISEVLRMKNEFFRSLFSIRFFFISHGRCVTMIKENNFSDEFFFGKLQQKMYWKVIKDFAGIRVESLRISSESR